MARAVPSFGARMNTSPLVLSRRRGQVGFRQVLGRVEVPFRGDLADDLPHLVAVSSALSCSATASLEFTMRERAVGDLRLQDVPCPSKNRKALLSRWPRRRTGQRVVGALGLVDQVLRLRLAHGDAVERRVVVYGVRVADQAVIEMT